MTAHSTMQRLIEQWERQRDDALRDARAQMGSFRVRGARAEGGSEVNFVGAIGSLSLAHSFQRLIDGARVAIEQYGPELEAARKNEIAFDRLLRRWLSLGVNVKGIRPIELDRATREALGLPPRKR